MIKSVQTGFANISNNVDSDHGSLRGTNITITSVDSTKCMLLLGTSFITRAYSSVTGNIAVFSATIKVTSNTNIQISLPSTATSQFVALRWQVIEFY